MDASRLTVCLARGDTGQIVAVDLTLYRRRQISDETYFLRFVDERDIVIRLWDNWHRVRSKQRSG